MPTEHILALLIQERDRLNRAIEVLEGPVKGRGRAPKNVAVTTEQSPTNRRRFTPAQRRKQSERMKAYWAAKRKSAK
jgi:hypothetical protein